MQQQYIKAFIVGFIDGAVIAFVIACALYPEEMRQVVRRVPQGFSKLWSDVQEVLESVDG